MRIDIHKVVASSRIVSAEIKKGRTTETFCKFPRAPLPALSVIARPSKLRVSAIEVGVAYPHIKDPVDHKHSAGLGPVPAFTYALSSRTVDICSRNSWRRAGYPGNPQAEFDLRTGFEPCAITVRCIEVIIITPGRRPVIAAFSTSDYRGGRFKLNSLDEVTGWVRRLYNGFHDGIEQILFNPSPEPLSLCGIVKV